MTAIFQEVIRPERLVFTCYVPNQENSLFEILNIATFTEQGGKTKLTFEAKSSNRRLRLLQCSQEWKRAGHKAWSALQRTWRRPEMAELIRNRYLITN